MPKVSSKALNEIAIREIAQVETEILSAIFFYYDKIIDLVDVDGISPDFFITTPGKKVFEALQKSKRNKELGYELVEIVATLKTLCKTTKELEEAEERLCSLSDHFQYYSIKDNWTRLKGYNLKTHMNVLAREIMDTPMNFQLIDDQVIQWRNKIDKINLLWSTTNLKSMDEVLKEWDNHVKHSLEEDRSTFLKTRYDALDKKIKDLGPGQLILIASRPGIGKTTFALNLLHQNLPYLKKKENEKVWGMGMFSLEMTNISLAGKMISICSGHPMSVIEKVMDGRHIEEWEQALINGAKAQLESTNIFLCDDSHITLGVLVSNIRRQVTTNNLKVVIIDYLQLINFPLDEEKRHSAVYQYQKIGIISRTLKLLALELNICIVALAQLNRKIEERITKDKSPLLSDLRESGSLEQDSDIVMFLYEEEKEEGSQQKSTLLKIGKNRNGPTGTIEFSFDKNRGTYKCLGEV